MNNPSQAIATINSWVNSATHEKIPTILDSVDSQTRLVLTSAIYFKGLWKSKFDSDDTKNDYFYTSTQERVICRMMNQTSFYNYLRTEREQIIDIPYRGNNSLVMTIILPTAKVLNDYEFDLDALTKHMKSTEVELMLPKFKTTLELKLKPILQELGLRQAFTPFADFSGITSDEKLFIDKVIHKAFIEVGELGTEAVASAASVTRCCASFFSQEPKEVFKTDHPFLFFIRSIKTDLIYFQGSLTNPTK